MRFRFEVEWRHRQQDGRLVMCGETRRISAPSLEAARQVLWSQFDQYISIVECVRLDDSPQPALSDLALGLDAERMNHERMQ